MGGWTFVGSRLRLERETNAVSRLGSSLRDSSICVPDARILWIQTTKEGKARSRCNRDEVLAPRRQLGCRSHETDRTMSTAATTSRPVELGEALKGLKRRHSGTQPSSATYLRRTTRDTKLLSKCGQCQSTGDAR
ncbi:hypothetical protein CABS01_09903 [Colletotrichum abscissum]|uniref:Uncharacterized protein n=3 Tax=Colletotrichum acutatum species complex TaxID=2707335 RepID=A0A9P9XNZ9_9PEZI|nr:uncharacterized protein CCOS01_13339 [Colletotrichum costaricense]XP_060378107.1 uncharacterized protein CTAM01_11242 [Colletotrichum tamarilloi]XP_060399957.1 uncharacterized protein CABS01_09903 [Colletotrichum abscissum]KAI3543771.1 hypothetical protein CSPX01_06094 [Colletotrichum filicis]KAI3556956.1 hypothetical protein CABS02_02963 [Colletotrichum abscissum]KAK1489093.1 hypothetical protein CTAM01_11242 [Colletotrichum tamarilloi]KAK1501168.1 hypothetical protein CABS01_09903 [Colle